MQSDQIQLLPEHIIDQIKAGEVIERPATLIKEIMENAIDAGSTKLDLHIIENGLELISLTDDGAGIAASQLPLAFCRHATSKIDRFEDIYRLSSYGFRGEALASIASVSKVSCETRTKHSYGQLNIEGGKTLNHYVEEKPHQVTGTKLFIKDLFFNTPVRMKFIQSKSSEKNQIQKVIQAFLMNHPQKEFSIKWDQQEKQIYPRRTTTVERIKDVLFKRSDLTFEEIQAEYDNVRIRIFLTHQSSRGNAHKSHFIFVNDRYIKEIPIHKVILNNSAPLWPEGETGHYICFIDIPKDEIDVNIHPNKTVIKFFRLNKVLSVLSGGIKAHLVPKKYDHQIPGLQKDLIPENLNEREVSYREVNFNLKEDVQHYFDHIHTDLPYDSNVSDIILQDSASLLLRKADKLFLIIKNTLINTHINMILAQVDSAKMAPLLVSKPITMNFELSDMHLKQAESFGFEMDCLDGTTYVARTFYHPLQIYPYLSILELMLKSNFNLGELDFYNHFKGDFKLTDSLLNEIVEDIGWTNLRAQNILHEISLAKLKSIYEI